MSIRSMFKDIPTWFIVLNIIILLPILLWPIIGFMSIFAMDSPNSGLLGQIIFMFGVGYPLILILVARANLKLYKVNRAISIFSTILMISVLYFFLLYGVIKIFEI